MLGYLTRKFLGLIITLILVSLAVFLVLRLLPGDPAQIILGTGASPESLARLRTKLGLNRPLYSQYINWIKGLLTGNLGESIFYKKASAT